MKLSAIIIVPFVLFIAASLVNQSLTGEDLATGEKQGLTAKEWGEQEFEAIATNKQKISSIPADAHRCTGSALCVADIVTRIVDGDTIYTDNYKIRLALVDTPEIGEEGFSKAAMFTAGMCPEGSVITIDQDDVQMYDQYDRLLANVYCDGKSVNSALLYGQLADLSARFCPISEFEDTKWAQTFGCRNYGNDM